MECSEPKAAVSMLSPVKHLTIVGVETAFGAPNGYITTTSNHQKHIRNLTKSKTNASS